MVRAKFKCDYVTRFPQSIEVVFTPVATGEENKTWSKWTPSGSLKLGITNPECFDKFEPGNSYFLDITPA